MTASPFNLITNPWLPVRRQSGALSIIRPAQVVEDVAHDPVVDFVWPRADFRIASLEFMIGLVATAFPPETHRDWLKLWRAPPSVSMLDEAFACVAGAFSLDGPNARFLQDHEDLQSGSEPVERLLIDAPGESTVKRNADLFVHRDQMQRFGRPAAAMALFALQSWAPSGGAGNMTGLRGGGPLLSLVLPAENASLWQILWANVPVGMAAKADDMPRIFPWLAPTVVSGKGGQVVRMNEDAHPLQCWWGMPRRIRLDFEKADRMVCDLTGRPDEVVVSGWRQRPYGPSYAGWIGQHYEKNAYVHPLTPRYRQKDGAEWLAVHPQPGGVGYRHWSGLVVESSDGNRLPASSVFGWVKERSKDLRLSKTPRLLAAGYDMDNMKARGFLESEMPLPGGLDSERQRVLDELARQCVGAATSVADILRGSVRDALFGKEKVSVDATILANIRENFWLNTEEGFFSILCDAAGEMHDTVDLCRRWMKILADAATGEFDAVVKLEPDTDWKVAERSARARRRLFAAVSGNGKEGEKIMNVLKIPIAVKAARASTAKGA